MTRTRKHSHPATAPAAAPVALPTREQAAAALGVARADLEAVVSLIDDPDARDAMMGAIVRYVAAVVNADRYERPTKAAGLAEALRALNATR